MKKYLILLLLMAFMAGSIPGALLACDLPVAEPNSQSVVLEETEGDGNADDDGGSEMTVTQGDDDSWFE